jgi:hypothetical protein
MAIVKHKVIEVVVYINKLNEDITRNKLNVDNATRSFTTPMRY